MSRTATVLPGVRRVLRTLPVSLIAFGLLLQIPDMRAAGNVTGIVFQDFNANGVLDTTATIPNAGSGAIPIAVDRGVGGVTVTAFDSANVPQGAATTAFDGTYTLTASGTGPYRIEFTGLPSGITPGPQGPGGTTMVQFVPDGASTGINLAVINAAEYCQNNPLIATPCYQFGNQATVTAPTFVSFPYSAGSVDGDPVVANYGNPTAHAIAVPAPQIGTTWGAAYSRPLRRIYVGAFFKKHSGFAPGGPGAVYVVNRDTGAIDATFTVPGATIDAHDAADFLHDNFNTGWDAVGKTSLGGVTVSDDGTQVFVMNLEHRTLYALDAQSGAVIASRAAPTALPGCPADGDARPFASTFHQGVVYVGLTCTAESSQNPADLHAYVYTADPASLVFSAAPVFQAALNYPRTIVSATSPAEWLPWSPVFANLAPEGIQVHYPQPWLTDIAFDNGGNLLLGIRDRLGDQAGINTADNPAQPMDLRFGVSAGDTLRACGTPASGWTLESDANCGGAGPTGGAGTDEGPGGGEFYFRDEYVHGNGTHHEITLGTLAQISGFPDAVAGAFDPVDMESPSSIFIGGPIWLRHATGGRPKSYRLFQNTDLGTFGKTNGLGDMAVLCDLAPIQIGNRMWTDANGNGIQDAGEAPRAGVVVQLLAPGGVTVLATATTDANGAYAFSNGPGTNTASSVFAIAGLTPNTGGYRIRIDTTQGTLAGTILTTPNNGGDSIDSDATQTGTLAEIAFTTDSAGVSNHTLDVGFVPPGAPIITGLVFLDADVNGVRSPTETGVGGVTVTVFDSSNTVQGTTPTGPNGGYVITPGGAGPYRVEFSTIPPALQPGPLGPDNGSTVQTVPGTPAANISLGLVDPAGACTNPIVATPCYLSGDPFAPGSTSGSNPVLVSLPYDSSGFTPPINPDAPASQIGSVWGLAWQRTTQKLFSGAFLKRHVGLGPLGLGGLYVTDYSAGDPATTPPTTTPFIDLAALGVPVGAIGPRGLPANGATPSLDTEAFGLVAKAGLGDLDLSEDGNTLYAVNLAARTLLRIDISAYNTSGTPPTATDITTIPVPDPTPACVNGLARPFALKFRGGVLYVGVTCTAELGGTTANLRAVIYRYDPVASAFTSVLDVPLDYTDGGAASFGCRQFEPWTDEPIFRTAGVNSCRRSPVVSDLEFDVDGSLIIGIMDRAGHQFGHQNFLPTEQTLVVNFAIGGDILRAANVGGVFVLENAGTTPTGGGCGVNTVFGGIGGGEYYCGERFNPHFETAMGGLALLPGSGELVAPVMDPLQIYSGGIRWFNNQTGSGATSLLDPRGAELYSASVIGSFGKANGLGDVELLCAVPPVEIGNFVWMDSNANGIQDPGEMPMGGVAVQLVAPDGVTILGTAITDASGAYLFSSAIEPSSTSMIFGIAGLTPNTSGYTLRLDLTQSAVGGKAPTTPNAGVNDAIDSDATTVGTNAVIPVNTDAPGANHSYDFGLTALTLGNLVWLDTNNNGVVDVGEPGIPGLTVNLYGDPNDDCAPDDIVITSKTDGSGHYLFTDLPAGNYIVEIIPPASFVSSTGAIGSAMGPSEPALDPDTDINNDDNGTRFTPMSVRSCAVTLAGGTEPTSDDDASTNTNLSVDFGLFPSMSLGDLVWQDSNNNCLRDPSEPALAGVAVSLLDATGTTRATTTTDAAGLYLFANLTPGDYAVQVAPPAGFASSTGANATTTGACEPGPDPDNNTNNTDDGAADGANVRSAPVTLTINGEPTNDGDADTNSNRTIDFGLYQPLSLGNLVFTDTNNNGIADAGEPGVPGISVSLLDPTTLTPLATTTTNASGSYLFTNLNAGDYVVEIVVPPGFSSSTGTPGAPAGPVEPAPDPDDDVDQTDNGTHTTPTSIRSAPVTLASGSEPVNDGDANANTNLTVDFGLIAQLALGDRVWIDTNNNGVLDAGEPGLAGVTVQLSADANGDCVEDGAIVGTTTTDATGTYRFDMLAPGRYIVAIVLPAGFVSSTGGATSTGGPFEPAPSPDTDVDSDDNGTMVSATRVRACGVTLAPNAEPINDGDANPNTNLTVDFGVFRPVALGNLVWFDRNNNGIVDPGEPGLSAIPVTLYIDADGNAVPDGPAVATAPTNAGGQYQFTNLTPGTYLVAITPPPDAVSSTGANGFARGPYEAAPDPDSDRDNDDNGTQTAAVPGAAIVSTPVTLQAASEPTSDGDGADGNLTVDFGLFTPASIGDRVWRDTNGDGVQDPDEPGVPGVPVTLHVPDGTVLASTITDPSGACRFDTLTPGPYFISLAPPPGLVPTPPGQGGDPSRDSDADPVSGRMPVTTLTPGEHDPTWDGGLVDAPGLTLGSHVFRDNDNNRRRDPNEDGISGVPVILYPDADADGVPDGPPIATTTTGADGAYQFTNLADGKYVVQIPADAFAVSGPLAGHVTSSGSAPPDDDVDNDDNGIPASGGVITSGTVMLNSGVEPTNDGDGNANSNLTVDFGFYRPNVPVIGLTLQAGTPIDNGDGTFDVPFTADVENLGSVPLTNIQVQVPLVPSFPLPTTFVVVPGSVSADSCLTANAAFDGVGTPTLLSGVDAMPVNGRCEIRFIVRLVPNGYAAPYVISGTATADGTSDVSNDDIDPDANGNSVALEPPDDVPVNLRLVPGGSDLELRVDHFGDPSQAGSIFDFFFRVTNRSSVATNGPITLVYTLPPYLRISPMPGMLPFGTGWACAVDGQQGQSGETVRCTYEAPVPADREISVTVWTEILQVQPVLASTGSVFYGGDPNLANNTATDAIRVSGDGNRSLADLGLRVDATAFADPGERVTARVAVTNDGPADAADVVLNAVLPASLLFQDAASTQGVCPPPAGGVLSCALGLVPRGAAVTVTVRTNASAPGGAIQTFAVRSTSTNDASNANNSGAAITQVSGIGPTTDTDRDGMPDRWELQFGLNPRVADAQEDPDVDGRTNLQEYQQRGHPRGFFRQLFAEGATNQFFATELAVLNPQAADANLWLTLMRDNGQLIHRYQRVAAMGRQTWNASLLLGTDGGSFSTLIESDVAIAADRGMRWDAMLKYGSSGEIGLPAPAMRWIFAEGATHGFQLFYLIENPDPVAAADVRITYFTPTGAPVIRTRSVPAHSRVTIYANEVPELRAVDVSAQIESTNGVPIVAERAMYRDANGQVFGAGHAGTGATEASTAWFFAEGATGAFFDTYVLVVNPGVVPATVTARYQLPSGASFSKDYVVAPASRRTISVENEDPRLAATSMAIALTSTQPIVAERAMWWPGLAVSPEWYEAHVSLGATGTGTKWAVAGGSAGGVDAEATFLLIANQAASAGEVAVTLVFDDGRTAVRTWTLPATSRTTIDVGAAIPEAVGRTFSAIVESAGASPVPLVVECARYSSPAGLLWSAGASERATRLTP